MNEIALGEIDSWAVMKEKANVMIKSGFLPPSLNTPEKVLSVGLAGKELGIGFAESVRSINVIQGKPTISPQLMLALANRTGQLEDIKIDSTPERCIATVTRKGRSPHTETFGVKEATDLGLMSKDNYRKQPATMMKWRALAAVLRVTFPDVMLGFYTPEELGAEVKIGDSEAMEVVSVPETLGYADTGIRVPKAYWDLRHTDPEKAQEALGGEGFEARKTPQGWFIFADESKLKERTPDFMDQRPADEFISHDQQLELFKLAKERGITNDTFKTYLKEIIGVEGTNKIKKEDYLTIHEWLNATDGAEVGK